jgi:hypothetical protein
MKITWGQLPELPFSRSFLEPINWRDSRVAVSASLASGAARGAAIAREARREVAKIFILKVDLFDKEGGCEVNVKV